jgi:hypothetical protein
VSMRRPRSPDVKIGDIIEITSTNFKSFFLGRLNTERVIGLVTRIDQGYETSHWTEWIYYVALIDGEIFSLYENEFVVISR